MEIAIVGNPNSGKTTLFNSLTGLRHATANYSGVTVEKVTGALNLHDVKESISVIDLPGSYSLLPRSIDEEIVHEILMGRQKDTPRPDLILFVADASNLARNLYFALQVFEIGIPTILVLNMNDAAEEKGIYIDQDKIEKSFGIPCVKTVANRMKGIGALKQLIKRAYQGREFYHHRNNLYLDLPSDVEEVLEDVANKLQDFIELPQLALKGEALRIIADIDFQNVLFRSDAPIIKEFKEYIIHVRGFLKSKKIDWLYIEMNLRYKTIDNICHDVIIQKPKPKKTISDRIDKILTHKVWGILSFGLIMGVIFQAIFSWASLPMDMISSFVDQCGRWSANILPDGVLESLVVDGIVAGVGNVVIFLPQIFILFFFIAFFEDLGYMARAAFVLDRVMKRAGLNGRAFLPLLSSFACAIPGIMAARTIQDKNDRLATILVAPLMSCSARLPVYALMIGAFIPAKHLFGIFDLKGVTLLAMYFFSIIAAFIMAMLFRKTFLKGNKTPFIFELPPYRVPHLKTVLLSTWDRGKKFLTSAGSIIFCISIILWFLASYPKNHERNSYFEMERKQAETILSDTALEERLDEIHYAQSSEAIKYSFAGRMGRMIEPAIKPLGFDWKIGIGIISSFAAREVFVSTLAIVYNIGDEADETSVDLIEALQNEKRSDGSHVYTPLTAITLMVFFVLACQCMSTIAVVKRETASWVWPIFMFVYMSALAWGASYIVYQGGKLLGF